MLSFNNHKCWLVFWLILNLSTNLKATNETDSLTALLPSLTDEEQKLHVLDQLGSAMMLIDYDSTVYYAHQAIPLAKKLGKAKIQAKLLRRIGIHHFENRDLEKARDFGHQAVNVILSAEEGFDILDKQYIFIGRSFLFEPTPMYDSVFHYFKLAEESNIKNDFPEEYNWEVYNEFGKLYGLTNQIKKADEYFQKAYDLTASQKDIFGYVSVRKSMMQYYFQSDQLDKYSKIAEECLQYQKKKSGNVSPDEGYHSELFQFEDIDEATKIERLQNAIIFHKKNNNLGMLTQTISSLASYFFSKKDCQKVLEVCQQGIDEILEGGEKIILKEYYRKSYECSKTLNDVSASLDFYEKYTAISDSINLEKIQQNLSELEIQYETKKKDLEIREKTFQRNMLFIASGLLGLLALAIFILLKNRLTTNKQLSLQANKIHDQRIKQLEQEKKILTYNAMIEGQESERKRIAKDLHDSIGGLLSTVKAHFTALREATEDLDNTNLFHKTNTLIDDACDEVRRISQNMMPRSLELSSLTHALEDIQDHLGRRGVHCQLEIIGFENSPMEEAQKVMVYRMIQELTTNILKHSGAKNVLIQLFNSGDSINILVEDDGIGFNIAEAKNKNGLGMKSIQSRIEYLQGTIDYDSVKNEGTTINISFPTQVPVIG